MRFLLCSLIAGLVSLPAVAQTYPAKPVRIVVPFAPGGGSDFIARFIAQRLTETMGKQFIVDNKPGAGGVIGIQEGLKAAPDGYTLTLIASSYSANPAVYKLNFDPIADITPIIQISAGPLVVVSRPEFAAKTTKDLVALAKQKPGQINFASSGQGSLIHLATELFQTAAGVKMNHIPYKGTGPALTDTLGGQVDVFFSSIASAVPHIQSGKLRAIAVTSPKRVPALPDVPTVPESGYPSYQVTNWHGLIAPKGVPADIVTKLNRAINEAMAAPGMDKHLEGDGLVAAAVTPDEFGALLRSEVERWGALARAKGIKAD